MTKTELTEILKSFASESLFDATGKLLAHLGVRCTTLTEEPLSLLDLYADAAHEVGAKVPESIRDVLARVGTAYFIGTVDDTTLVGETSVEEGGAAALKAAAAKEKYNGLYVFAVQMKPDTPLSRADAATVVRAINRLAQQKPATVLILEGATPEKTTLSIATCERSAYKQTWRPGERLGKVSILKGIDCHHPHRGHLDILESMNVKKAKSFDVLYEQWKEVFSTSLLTKQFYREIQNWYFWALKKEQHVAFPNALDNDADDGKYNAENMIRLITRLIFTWFMKEKGLVNPALFDEGFLSTALRHFDPEGRVSDAAASDAANSCTYYRAILQNLFFATFNQEVGLRDFVDTQVRDSKRYNIKNYYRNEKLFAETDRAKIIAYFNGSPFVNGGLFDCLDNVEQNGHVYSWDGFSNNVRFRDGSLKSALIPDRLFFGGETTVDLSEFFEKGASAKSVKVRGIINILKDYVFTIEENTPLDEDVALDPELLGKVFENLLGCYNPETKQMARNATGSFYTPREIVNYMVKVSLKSYLTRACPAVAAAEIDALVEGTAELVDLPSVKASAKDILVALFKAKILDPACGSGAFPMGIMSAMVGILRTVDPDNLHWYEIVLKESLDEAAAVADIGDEEERAALKAQIEYDFKERVSHPDYARKLYVIEHCIFGSDIQPIAAQISRLRFFITLLCEQSKSDDPAKNYGITPLPNLESNFVAANSLLSIDLKDMRELLGQKKIVSLVKQLHAIRHQLFLPKTSDRKRRLKRKDADLREAIAVAAEGLYDENVEQKCAMLEREIKRCDEALATLGADDFEDLATDVEEVDLFGNKTVTKKKVVGKGNALLKEKAKAESEINSLKNASRKVRLLADIKRLVAWNPFAFNVAESFLDPEWMFGVKDGFDIVIGNPPYIQLQINGGELAGFYEDKGFKVFNRMGDIYCLFYERGHKLLGENGVLCYITSDKWMRNSYGDKLRDYFVENTDCRLLIDFDDLQIFEAATVETNILLFGQEPSRNSHLMCCSIKTLTDAGLLEQVSSRACECSFEVGESWVVATPIEQNILKKVARKGRAISECNIEINFGLKTGLNDAFIVTNEQRDELIKIDSRTAEMTKPLLRGRDIRRFGYNWSGLWLLFVPWHFPLQDDETIEGASNKAEELFSQDYPAVYNYLLGFKEPLMQRNSKEVGIRYEWYALQRWGANYKENFLKPKIVWGEIADSPKFAYDDKGDFYCEATTFMMTGEELPLMYLFLNSRLCLHCFSKIGTATGMGTLRWKKYKLEQLRVPVEYDAHRVNSLVDRILVAKKNDPASDTSAIEEEIDELVFDLYGLTAEEREIVKGGGK